CRVLIRGPHGKFVHVRLSDNNSTGGAELLDKRCVKGRAIVFEHLTPAGRPAFTRREDVLERYRDSAKGRRRFGGKLLVGESCLRERKIAPHISEGIERLRGFYPIETKLDKLDRGDLLVPEERSKARDRKIGC